MLPMSALLDVADNSGARRVKIIKVLGGSRRRTASVGDVVVVAIRDAIPNSKLKAGSKARAVIVRVAQAVARSDGSLIKFGDNSAVLINQNGEPIGTRIFGPVDRKLRSRGFMKIVSLAPEVL